VARRKELTPEQRVLDRLPWSSGEVEWPDVRPPMDCRLDDQPTGTGPNARAAAISTTETGGLSGR